MQCEIIVGFSDVHDPDLFFLEDACFTRDIYTLRSSKDSYGFETCTHVSFASCIDELSVGDVCIFHDYGKIIPSVEVVTSVDIDDLVSFLLMIGNSCDE